MKTPPRTPTQLKRHYEVEKALADRLRAAGTREERAALYETMYDTLFAEVPDHPRLTKERSIRDVEAINRRKLRIVDRFLRPDMTVADIGSGDCTFARRLCAKAQRVYAVDIADQRDSKVTDPPNFELVVYDGFHLPLEAGCVDLAFSDQLVEHLHPDDAEWHFRMILAALAPGGVYLFRTPHRFTGPHDISRYFTTGDPQGFHLKEWTFRELRELLGGLGYRRVDGYWSGRGRLVPVPMALLSAAEAVVGALPRRARAAVARLVLPTVVLAAHK